MAKNDFECQSCSKEPTGRVNVARFIEKLDECFSHNDLAAASRLIDTWEREARAYDDRSGLLSILNEELGFYRRTKEKERGIRAALEAAELMHDDENPRRVSFAVIFTNAATTLKVFGEVERALALYREAEEVFLAFGQQEAYEYAAMLNNRATAYMDLERYDEAERSLRRAMDILQKEGKHNGDIAISLVTLSHLLYDRDDARAVPEVEKNLDLAWDILSSPDLPHDANYAYILTKVAPSFAYFGRTMEAEALQEVAKEVYHG